MIRPAVVADVPVILDFIEQLAESERLRHACRATPEALIAEEETGPVGFALFFHNYSTFLAQPGIYLEDLFVVPGARGKGHVRALLGAPAQLAVGGAVGG